MLGATQGDFALLALSQSLRLGITCDAVPQFLGELDALSRTQ